MTRPLLLLDVDGVLCPFGVRHGDSLLCGPPGAEHVLYDAGLPARLTRLAACFELVWATAWEDEANEVLSEAFGLPPLPVVRFDDSAELGETWKLPAIRAFVGDRPFAWIDDDIGHDAHAWAKRRGAPTLLLDIKADVGLSDADADLLVTFGEAVGT